MIKQHEGRKVERSLDTDIKRIAEQRYAKIVSEIIDGTYFNNLIRKRTLREMIDRFKAEQTEARGYYQKARDKSIFKHLFEFFGEQATLQEVERTVGGYEYHRRKQKKKAATIVKELGLLRRMFNVARKQWKWNIANPVTDIELPTVRSERVRYLSADEYSRLFKALDNAPEKWLKACVTIAIDTGLRLSNVCNLKWDEVNLFSRMIVISAEKMKNADYIGMPLTERVAQTLKELQKVKSLSGYVLHENGEKLYYVKIQRAFRNALKAAEITNFRFHDLRHTFASYLRQRGVDLHTIATLAGHRDLRMTKRYAHLNVDSLRDAVAKLETTTILLQQGSVKECSEAVSS